MIVDGFIDICIWLIKLIFKMFSSSIRSLRKDNSTFKLNVEKTSTVPNNIKTNTTETPFTEPKYTLKQSLITDTERNFLNILKEIVGDKYVIESQVPLSGIVNVKDSNKHWTNYHDFNLIKAKSIDFVLYGKDYRPYKAIELDDRSHLKWSRIKRDQLVDEIMKSVGLPILHIPAGYSYNIEKLKEEILK